MKSSAKKIELASVDDLFSTEEGRQDAKLEKIQEIPLSELHPFKNHPFKVKDDEAMMETADSIKQYGVLVPAIARPDPEGGYELVAGHRRRRASELAEKETMPVIIRDLDDDAATIIMVDSNLQRESLLPSERAFAYKMKLEAVKHQGARTDLTSRQVGEKSQTSIQKVADQAGESQRQVQRYIRLTELIPELMDHIIWSAVNADCDRKFRNFWGSTKAVRRLSDTICIENGLSIVENPKLHGKSYNKWLGDQAKPSHREQLRVMIDRALEQKPADFDALLKLLTEMGCEVSRRGKAIRLKAPGWKNVARMDDKLGAGYSEAEIRAVLAGEKRHTPRKKSLVQPEPPKVNLLVDIQAKLQAGKGAGYARWAKVFNLKQMAQTMNYLSENNLLEYAVLEEKAAAATAHHNELSAQIKAAEKRMAEIAVLRTHIVNYAKTREVYVAYRKAGYSKKFREEHEEEILLHQAAKNAFDEMGVKKLPKVKELQTEYAKLLEEKKKTYAEYRRSREEMRELLTAKANVDRVLKMEVEQDVEKEKDHGQR